MILKKLLHYAIEITVFMQAALNHTQLHFLTQGLVHTHWSTHWLLDLVWPVSPSLGAPSPTRCSAIFPTTTRCCATRCLVRGVSLTQHVAVASSVPHTHTSVGRRSGVSPRAARPDSSHVCRSPAPGHARSVCRAAENGNGAAVAAWASPARRPSTKSGGLLQVSKDPESPSKGFTWVSFFVCLFVFMSF